MIISSPGIVCEENAFSVWTISFRPRRRESKQIHNSDSAWKAEAYTEWWMKQGPLHNAEWEPMKGLLWSLDLGVGF